MGDRGCPGCDTQGRGERERGADARRALEDQVAAHQPRQPPADRQAQAGAPVLARRRAVGLRERAEQPALLLRGDADTRIPHADRSGATPASAPAAVRRLDPHHHLAALGELERIAHQVGEHLPHAEGVADSRSGTSSGTCVISSTCFSTTLARKVSVTSSSTVAQAERRLLELPASRLLSSRSRARR